MITWEFKSLQRGADGTAELSDLSEEQQARCGNYIEALHAAGESNVPNPIFSGYRVGEGIGFRQSEMLKAGNVEYGFCQAMHAEETAVAAFRSCFGRRGQRPVLSIIAGSSGNIATPCGNCRDILLDEFGPELEIVSGVAYGGLAVVSKLDLYLRDEFEHMKPGDDWTDVLEKASMALRQGALLVNDAYSPTNAYPERKYFALIDTRDHKYVGAHDVMCDYHPIYALRDAIRQARRANDPFVQSVVIVGQNCDGNMPHVMYKDRQHLMELCLQGDLLTGKECDPPIYLMSRQGKRQATNAWKTSVKQWLPFPFSPRNFGPEFIEKLTGYYRNLGRR